MSYPRASNSQVVKAIRAIQRLGSNVRFEDFFDEQYRTKKYLITERNPEPYNARSAYEVMIMEPHLYAIFIVFSRKVGRSVQWYRADTTVVVGSGHIGTKAVKKSFVRVL